MTSIVDLHNIVPVIPQIMSDPQYVFISPLSPKVDEGWQPWFQDWLKAVVPLGTVAIGFMMWKISNNQHDISKKQLEISSYQFDLGQSQVEIARQQKEIARIKLNLEIFSKKYEFYVHIKNLAWDFSDTFFSSDVDHSTNISDKIYSSLDESRILFSEEVYDVLSRFWHIVSETLSMKSDCLVKSGDVYECSAETRDNRKEIIKMIRIDLYSAFKNHLVLEEIV